ncbi:Trichothecene efflux pump [Colletotrichum higginsianum IMI 349063]|uniref:Trichothecene efflux pump n=1 Tax=Colletotrichum higginsianum (strain IMI 349063) TaxID=759273 RepID=A0A1B7Y1G5_COLHI|nr:Trichothecene efflux pump [Colletotrichum higginsianum IMI 349063]OBR05856.1 Trichothecene efflux pump [Colletotrichum higginsianum IMI 349063]
MATASSSADHVDVARNQGEGGAREHNRQDANTDVSNLPGNVESLIHLDGTARQIEIQIRGHPEHWSNRTFVFIMVAQNLGSFAACSGWVAFANSRNHVNTELRLPENDHQLSTMWLLGSSIGFLLVGRLSDLFGRRWFIVCASFLGAIGSILGWFGSSIGVHIAANICNGIAAAAQISFAFVVGELVPVEVRALYFPATLLAPCVAAFVLPAVTPTASLDNTTAWRRNYCLGTICAFFSAWIYLWCYFPPSYRQLNVAGGSMLQMVKSVDIIGIFFFIFGCVLTLFGLSCIGPAYQWGRYEVVGMLLGGGTSFLAFFIHEVFFCRTQALLPPKLFRNRHYVALVNNAVFASMTYSVVYVLWPTIVGKVFDENPDAISNAIAWQAAILGGSLWYGMALAGTFLSLFHLAKSICLISASVAMIVLGCLGGMQLDELIQITVLVALLCVAIGFIENVAITGVTYVWDAQDIGLAFGVLGCLCSLSCAFAQVGFASILD